ncbi:MAG: hypothetical protein Wins2KO_29530 [Winogradskyella sp.]|uniref:mechanosensitive ion channel family protein n=1 Tax=Winogradskyella sp. TaxID=1883156 RepID=UPI0025EA3DA0|nr:mechanosensitive ion channel domain-containing protein [Winogradskyella sp.]NRB58514.1 mechanosensitive ion channel [Winogradskyella sp.]
MNQVKEFSFKDFFSDVLNTSIYDNGDIHINVKTLLVLVITLLLTNLFLRAIRLIVTKRLSEDYKQRFRTVFGFLKYIIFLLVIITTLDASGIKITALVAASAALFVGLGFGLQHLFEDVISGIVVISDKSIFLDDIITIEGVEAKIFEINLRTTKAITQDNKILIIPNHKFVTDVVVNWTQNNPTVREEVNISVAYGTDVDKFKILLEEVALKHDKVLKDPKPFSLFEYFGDSGLDFKLYFFTKNTFEVPVIKSDLRFAIYNEVEKQKIEIPFPQRVVHVKNENI